MNLIDRYIYAVTRHLPVDLQADVADELRSTIEDQLDEMGSRSKKNIEKVLTTLGDPEILARKYKGGKQYLIGPAFYPSFLRILKISLSVGLPIAFIFQLISQLGNSSLNLSSLLVSIIGATIAIGIQILFWVGLTFFVLERSGVSANDMRQHKGDWTPSLLPNVPKERQIPISDAVTDIVTYSFVIALPFLAQFIGIHTDDGRITPFFDPAIWAIATPAVITLGAVGVIKGILKLVLRNWSKWLIAFNLVYALIFSAALVGVFLKSDIVNPAFLSIFDANVDTADLAQVKDWTIWTIGISFAVTIGIFLYDAFRYIPLAFKLGKHKANN